MRSFGKLLTVLSLLFSAPALHAYTTGNLASQLYYYSEHPEKYPDKLALVEQSLTDPDSAVRAMACLALSHYRNASDAAKLTLISLLADPSYAVRRSAASAIGQLKLATPASEAALEIAALDADWTVRRQAMLALGQIGSSSEATISALVAGLSDNATDVRWAAVRGLQYLQRKAISALPTLIAHMNDSSALVRAQTAAALGVIDPNNPDVIAALFDGLWDYDAEVRRHSEQGLSFVGADGLPFLIRGLKESRLEVRIAVARLISHVVRMRAKENIDLLPQLIAYLSSSDEDTRWYIAEALMGLEQEKVSAAMAAAYKDGNSALRAGIVEAIGTDDIETDTALRLLSQAFSDPDPTVRLESVWAVGEVASAKSAIAPLIRTLGDADAQVGDAAAWALSRYGADAVAPLTNVLANEDSSTRINAILALQAIGKDAAPAISKLDSLSKKDPDPAVRAAAAAALIDIR